MLSLNYEYRVIPAPRRAPRARARGLSCEDRFAQSLANLMNDMGSEGWDMSAPTLCPWTSVQG
jgi:hypothetical protein